MIYFLAYVISRDFRSNKMDFPHTPTNPDLLFIRVQTEVKKLWAYVDELHIPGINLEIRWKKQVYGGWCILRWKPKNYCHCKDPTCFMGKCVMKETKMIIRDDFSFEAFVHVINCEKQWINNFVKE